MKITKSQLSQIIKEELSEVFGMDAQYDRHQLAARVRDLLDEYTGEDLEAAMDTLNAVQAMLSAEMAEYDEADLGEGAQGSFFGDAAEEESAEADQIRSRGDSVYDGDKPERDHPYAKKLRSAGLTYTHSAVGNDGQDKTRYYVYRLGDSDVNIAYFNISGLGQKWLWKELGRDGKLHGFDHSNRGLGSLSQYIKHKMPRANPAKTKLNEINISKNRAMQMAAKCAHGYLQGAGFRVDMPSLQRAVMGSILQNKKAS